MAKTLAYVPDILFFAEAISNFLATPSSQIARYTGTIGRSSSTVTVCDGFRVRTEKGMCEDEGGENRERAYSEWEVIASISPPPEELKHLLPPTPNTVSPTTLSPVPPCCDDGV